MQAIYKARIQQSLKETKDALAKEMICKEHLRNSKMVDFYNSHIIKLQAMLSQDECVIDGMTY